MNEPQAQPQDCPHHVVVMYATKGRFAPPKRYWSCQDCGADFVPSRADLPRATEGELTIEAAMRQIREMLPHSWAQLTVNANYDRDSYELHVPDFKKVKEFVAPTLESLVNELRTWAKSRDKGDSDA